MGPLCVADASGLTLNATVLGALLNGLVTLGSDYRTILKSDPILLILEPELDVPILKIDKCAVTLLRFIGADFIARKMRQKHCLATLQKSALICEQDRKPVPTF